MLRSEGDAVHWELEVSLFGGGGSVDLAAPSGHRLVAPSLSSEQGRLAAKVEQEEDEDGCVSVSWRLPAMPEGSRLVASARLEPRPTDLAALAADLGLSDVASAVDESPPTPPEPSPEDRLSQQTETAGRVAAPAAAFVIGLAGVLGLGLIRSDGLDAIGLGVLVALQAVAALIAVLRLGLRTGPRPSPATFLTAAAIPPLTALLQSPAVLGICALPLAALAWAVPAWQSRGQATGDVAEGLRVGGACAIAMALGVLLAALILA